MAIRTGKAHGPALTGPQVLYFWIRRNESDAWYASIVELGHGGHGALASQHLVQGGH